MWGSAKVHARARHGVIVVLFSDQARFQLVGAFLASCWRDWTLLVDGDPTCGSSAVASVEAREKCTNVYFWFARGIPLLVARI